MNLHKGVYHRALYNGIDCMTVPRYFLASMRSYVSLSPDGMLWYGLTWGNEV